MSRIYYSQYDNAGNWIIYAITGFFGLVLLVAIYVGSQNLYWKLACSTRSTELKDGGYRTVVRCPDWIRGGYVLHVQSVSGDYLRNSDDLVNEQDGSTPY